MQTFNHTAHASAIAKAHAGIVKAGLKQTDVYAAMIGEALQACPISAADFQACIRTVYDSLPSGKGEAKSNFAAYVTSAMNAEKNAALAANVRTLVGIPAESAVTFKADSGIVAKAAKAKVEKAAAPTETTIDASAIESAALAFIGNADADTLARIQAAIDARLTAMLSAAQSAIVADGIANVTDAIADAARLAIATQQAAQLKKAA